ncbi:hypothetical protein GCM10027053_03860 [Intrasporangium mesophilum]
MNLPNGLQMVPRPASKVAFYPSVIPVQDAEPAGSAMFWVDTSTAPPTLKGWDGAAWVAVGGGGLDTEAVQDLVAAQLVAGSNITLTYNDPAGTLTVASSAVLPVMSPKVGSWMTAPDIRSYATNSSQTRSSGNGPALGVPIYKAMTVDALACIVDTLEAASTIRLGIYSSDSDGYPATLLGSVSVAGTATGTIIGTFGAPITLTPGLHWLVARVSSLTTLRLRGCVPAHQSVVGVSGLVGGTNVWVGANFGTSSALNNVSTYAQDLPDHTALVGMRRSA